MATFLEQLIDLSLRDNEAFTAMMDGHSREITPELAIEAHGIFIEAMKTQQFGYAAKAACTASSLYLALGDRHAGLKHYIYFQQMRYMVASTEEAYQNIREVATGLISMAEEISAFDLAFASATLAANCAYFTGDLQDAPAAKEQWMRLTLGDLILASGYGPRAVRDDLEQFVSLLTGFMEIITTLVPSPDTVLELQLRQLAQAVENFVPEDFRFQIYGDSTKSANSARWLAVLSRRFGNSDVAKRRLELLG